MGGGLGARSRIGGHSRGGKRGAGSRGTASFGSTPEVAAWPLARCPRCWLRARVRSRGCAMAAVEGAPVEREAGGGLEVRLLCVRRAGGPFAWIPPGSGVERSAEAGGGLLFSPCGQRLGSRDVGTWSVVLGLLRPRSSSWSLACPVHRLPPAASHCFTQLPFVGTANDLPQTQNQPSGVSGPYSLPSARAGAFVDVT